MGFENNVFPLRLRGFAPLRRNSKQTLPYRSPPPPTDVSALDSLKPDLSLPSCTGQKMNVPNDVRGDRWLPTEVIGRYVPG